MSTIPAHKKIMLDQDNLRAKNANPSPEEYEVERDVQMRMFAVDRTISALQCGVTFNNLTDGAQMIYDFIRGKEPEVAQ